MHTSHIEIHEKAVENNINFIKNLLGDSVVFSSVVKGNAYGHGIDIYCPLAFKYGVRHFSVSDAHEAYTLKQVLPNEPISIMIMSMIDHEQMAWAIENEIEFYVFNPDRLKAALKAAKKIGKPAKVHIEMETGMNRTGFRAKSIQKAFQLLKRNTEHLEVKGFCTHLAGAESIANYKRISDQQKKFRKTVAQLEALDWLNPKVHMASSAATIRYPKTRYDLVRLGILQYGFFPTKEIQVHYMNKHRSYQNPLQRIVSWKTRVMEVKKVKPGQFIGYGTSYFTNVPTTIAILPVGYSSGYSRSLSNRGKVLIRGRRIDVIGTVNMNMIAVDVSGLENVKIGEEVVLIGFQGEMEISVSSFSDFSQLINYELLTRIPKDIPRKIV